MRRINQMEGATALNPEPRTACTLDVSNSHDSRRENPHASNPCSSQQISRMEGMETLSRLTKLDLSFNPMRRLENLKNLSTLTSLEMNSNLIHRAEDLSMLRKYCGGLTSLNFANNPVCDMKSYRQ